MLISLARWVIVASGLWLIFVSGLMLLRPTAALRYLGQMASTNLINYSELILRLIWGIAMMQYAERSLFSDFLNGFGILLTVTSIVLLLIPRRWHAAYAVYWSAKLTPLLVRSFAPVSLLFGIFLIWAVA